MEKIMESYKMVDLMLESIYESDYFESEFEKMNIINFLRLFFHKYDFYDFVDTHQITEYEYKRYFKDNVKFHNPKIHKRIKKMYKINRGGLI